MAQEYDAKVEGLVISSWLLGGGVEFEVTLRRICMRKICITISTDAQGFSKNATLLASIVRRTQRDVLVRCYTRGFSQRS
jgi:hypothetical protein